jgi:hypothetical protein
LLTAVVVSTATLEVVVSAARPSIVNTAIEALLLVTSATAEPVDGLVLDRTTAISARSAPAEAILIELARALPTFARELPLVIKFAAATKSRTSVLVAVEIEEAIKVAPAGITSPAEPRAHLVEVATVAALAVVAPRGAIELLSISLVVLPAPAKAPAFAIEIVVALFEAAPTPAALGVAIVPVVVPPLGITVIIAVIAALKGTARINGSPLADEASSVHAVISFGAPAVVAYLISEATASTGPIVVPSHTSVTVHDLETSLG